MQRTWMQKLQYNAEKPAPSEAQARSSVGSWKKAPGIYKISNLRTPHSELRTIFALPFKTEKK